MASSWRIVFFGTPAFALPSLKKLFEGPDEVIAVVTQPDREKGRGKKKSPSPVKEVALQHGVALLQPEKVREDAFLEAVNRFAPDLLAVVAFGQLLPGPLLRTARFGAVNVHASLLPLYRGAAPIARAILGGARATGVTTMLMDEGMDTGDILMQAKVPIEPEDTGESLQDKLSALGGQLLGETLEKMKAGRVRTLPQDHSKATYAPPLRKEEGRIDWKRTAEEIHLQIRALIPWPVAFTLWNGRLLRIYRGEVRTGESGGREGSVAWVGSDFIEVRTGKGSLLIREVQLEGKRRMSVRDFLSGHPIPEGAVFS